jgi:hypothetical protein
MIGPGGFLLVVPTNMQFQVQLLVGLPPKKLYTETFNFIIQSDILSTSGDALMDFGP